MTIDITALFCCLDDFCELYEREEKRCLLSAPGHRQREGKLCISEMMFVMALFHVSPFKHFKAFYKHGIEGKYRDCFNELPCYARFVQLMRRLLLPFSLLIHAASAARRPATTSPAAPSSPSATIGALRRIGCSAAWRSAAKPQWDGSMASSCTSSSMTSLKSWR